MTVERGASKQEEESAKMSIKRLQEKAEISSENEIKYVVIGTIPGHMRNPNHCNWHIEKDGIIIAKGNGILKYREVCNYYIFDSYMKGLQEFNKNKKEYIKNYMQKLMRKDYYNTEEKLQKATENHLKDMERDAKLCADFEKFIHKIDTTCGGLIGKGDNTTNVIYEKVIVTKYKVELKPVEIKIGSIKEGQLFILKANFNRGCMKGLVYRIHEREYKGKKSYYAYKLNNKLTKECKGTTSTNLMWTVYEISGS